MSVINKINVGGQEYDLNAATVAKTISYDNTSSGLTAANVQTAIDEVTDKINTIDLAASKVTFDDTETQLGSDNVQGAITALNSNLTESIAELKLPEYKLNTEEAIGTLDGKTVYRKRISYTGTGETSYKAYYIDTTITSSNSRILSMRTLYLINKAGYYPDIYNGNNYAHSEISPKGVCTETYGYAVTDIYSEVVYTKISF